MVKDKITGLKLEGGSKINPSQKEDLKLVDDNLKKLSKEDATKMHQNLQNELNQVDNKDYLKYIEDMLTDSNALTESNQSAA